MIEVALPDYRAYYKTLCELPEPRFVRNYREVNEVGLLDLLSERGWIPVVAGDATHPYYADQIRASIVANSDGRLRIVQEGRPDAVIPCQPDAQMALLVPQWKNKLRQLRKAQSDLEICFVAPTCPLPWKKCGIHLAQKYNQVDVAALPDVWFVMPSTWISQFHWISLYQGQDLLGAAYFKSKANGTEWFWVGTVMDHADPRTRDYSIGNVLLLLGFFQARSSGAQMFNLGVDRFDYKPRMWGTQRQWAEGLAYV